MTAGDFWAIYEVVFGEQERKQFIADVGEMLSKVEGLKDGDRT